MLGRAENNVFRLDFKDLSVSLSVVEGSMEVSSRWPELSGGVGCKIRATSHIPRLYCIEQGAHFCSTSYWC